MIVADASELTSTGYKLYPGDCLEEIGRIGNRTVRVVITDPPYGIDYKSNRQGIDRKQSIDTRQDTVVREQYFSGISHDDSLPTEWLSLAYDKIVMGGAIYIFSHWRTWHELFPAVEQVGFKVKNMIVLNKSNHGMGDLTGSFAPKHELLMFATKGRHTLNFPSGREKDVWDVPVVFSGRKRLHPNEKPERWIEPAVIHSTSEGDVVLDPFMGSGTTGSVCLRLGRRFIGIEIGEKEFAIAERRIYDSRRLI